MAKNDPMKRELDDMELKLQSARQAAEHSGATEKDKADLKLIEQEYMAAQQKANRDAPDRKPDAKSDDPEKKVDRRLDDALKGTFPASDPVSFVQAAPVKEQDRALPAVKAAEKQQPEKTAAARKSKSK